MANKKFSISLRQSAAATIRGICGQIAIVALPLMLFFIGADLAVGRNGNGTTAFGTVCTLLLSAIFIISFGIWLSLLLLAADVKKAWRENRLLLLLILVSLVLRLPQIGTTPFQDYAVYYSSLKKICAAFELAPAYMLDAMRLAAHPSYAYTLVAAIPEFFFPGNFSNMWLMQTVLSLLVVAGVYHILFDTVNLKKPAAFIGALLVSCCPFFLGMDAYFQLDFGSAVFFFLFLWAFLDKKIFLTVVLAGGLVLTKEFGIVLLAGFIIGALLYYLLCTKGSLGARFMAIFRDTRMMLLLLIGLAGGLVMIYYLFFSAKAWVDISAIFGNEGTTRLGYIGFNAAYIKYKLVQLFAMNFGWLLAVLTVTGLLFGLIRKGKRKLPAQAVLLVYGCLCAAFFYMVFSCAMVTYTVPRYNIVLHMILSFLAAIALLFNFGAQAGVILCAGVTALLAVQGYLTIDPVMKAIYPPMQTGTINMVYSSFLEGHFIGDNAVYNYQYSFITKALREILEDQNYDGSADVVFLGTGNDIAFGTQDRYGWDPEKKKLTFMDADSIPFHIYSTSYNNEYIEPELGATTMPRAIFIAVPESRPAEEVYSVFSSSPFAAGLFTNFEAHEAAVGGFGGKLYYWTADRI